MFWRARRRSRQLRRHQSSSSQTIRVAEEKRRRCVGCSCRALIYFRHAWMTTAWLLLVRCSRGGARASSVAGLTKATPSQRSGMKARWLQSARADRTRASDGRTRRMSHLIGRVASKLAQNQSTVVALASTATAGYLMMRARKTAIATPARGAATSAASTTIPFETLDVFTPTKYGGNPLAVVFDLEQKLTDDEMQKIAMEFGYRDER